MQSRLAQDVILPLILEFYFFLINDDTVIQYYSFFFPSISTQNTRTG